MFQSILQILFESVACRAR